MRPSEIKNAIKVLYRAETPGNVKGSPGIGKTEIFNQATDELTQDLGETVSLIVLHLSQYDRVDLTGLPIIVNGRTQWATPDFFPTSGRGIILLDDLPAAPRELQPPCYQLLREFRIGGYQLPPGWIPFTAGNLSTDRAMANKLSTAIDSRVIHLHYELHVDDWCKWAVSNDINPVLIAFVRFRPELFLTGFDPKSKESAYLCPRTLAMLSNVLAQKPSRDIEHALIAGTIGPGPAAEISGFIRLWRKLPSLDAIMTNPSSSPVPNDSATLFAVAGGLARKSTAANYDRVLTYGERMPKEWQTYLVKDSTDRDESVFAKLVKTDASAADRYDRLVNTTAYIKWASENSNLIS
jgi:hypothetical protein